ncbi:MAG: T9SS type A sorting domain-containing protein [Chitinophagaceae bacterium]|nr:T9SS type A sorting domain-containing protein [Chitinophagaceae bacterium]
MFFNFFQSAFSRMMLVAMLCHISFVLKAQWTESFEFGLPASYNSTPSNINLSSGQWQIKDVQSGSNGVQSGLKSAQFRSATGSQIITPILPAGIHTLSFYVSASTASGAYQVNVSSDGGQTWTPAPGSPFTIGTSKTFRQIILNSYSVNRIQIYRTGAVLYVDDVAVTTPPTFSLIKAPNAMQATYGSTSTTDSLTVMVHQAQSNLQIQPSFGLDVSTDPFFNSNLGNATQALIIPSISANTSLTIYTRISNTTPAGTYTGHCSFSTNNTPMFQVNYAGVLILPKPLSIQNCAPANKVYDANNAATIVGNCILGDVLPGDTNALILSGIPIAEFDSPDVGINKSVSLSGYVLSGLAMNNYFLASTYTLQANILQAPQHISISPCPSLVYIGDAPWTINAVSNFNLPLLYSVNDTNKVGITLDGKITWKDTGVVMVHISQIGNANVLSADTIISFVVERPACITQTSNLTYAAEVGGLPVLQANFDSLWQFFSGSLNWNALGISNGNNAIAINTSTSNNGPNGSYHFATTHKAGLYHVDSSHVVSSNWYLGMGQHGILHQFSIHTKHTSTAKKKMAVRSSLDNYQSNWFELELFDDTLWHHYSVSNMNVTATANDTIKWRLLVYNADNVVDTSMFQFYFDDLAWNITASNLPDSAWTGPNQTRCGMLQSLPLGGNEPQHGEGTWSQITGPGISVFSQPHQGNSTVSVSVPGLYTYRWTIRNLNCTTEYYTDVQIRFAPLGTWDNINIVSGNCFADSAEISIAILGGTPPYTFLIPGKDSVQSPFKLSEGIYTIVASDAYTCNIETTIQVQLSAPLQVNVQIAPPSCFGQLGLLTILAQGGNGGYTYKLNGVTVTPSSNVYAGTYTVTVSDLLGCTIQTVATVSSPPPLTITSNIQLPQCLNCLHTLNINASGGTPSYWYYVNGQNGNATWNLLPGNYTIVVEDANACNSTASIQINSPVIVANNPPIKITKTTFGHAAWLAWEGNNNDSIYRLDFKAIPNGAWTAHWCANKQDTLYPLNENTQYAIRIKAYDSNGVESAWVYDTLQTSNGCNPVIIDSLVAGSSYVRLVWHADNADSYRLEYKPVDSLTWRPINTGSVSRVIRNLKSNTPYQFRIQSLCVYNDWSIWTDTLITTSPPTIVPTIDTTIVYGNSAIIKWKNIGGVQQYRTEFKLSSQSTWESHFASDTLEVLQNLIPNKVYHFRVRSQESDGDTSTWCNMTFTTGSGCIIPSFQSPYIQGNMACLYWTAVADSAYRIEYKALNQNNWIAALTGAANYCLNNLTPNTAYVCRVKSICKNADQSMWHYDTIYTTAGCSLPIWSTINSGATSAYFSWTHPNASQFRLEYKPSNTPTWQSLKLKQPYRTINNLIPGTTYQVRLRAECPNGDISAWEYDSLMLALAKSNTNWTNSDDTTGLNKLPWVSIYPNPASDIILLKIQVDDCEPIQCTIINPLGQRVYYNRFSFCPNEIKTIPLNQLVLGNYIIQVQHQSGRLFRSRFIKKE